MFKRSLTSPIDVLTWVESMIQFETKNVRGKGVNCLVSGEDGIWKAYMIYTSLQELKDYTELSGDYRPHGGNQSARDSSEISKRNWLERLQNATSFNENEPDVLVSDYAMPDRTGRTC